MTCSCKEGLEIVAKCDECDDFMCALCFFAHARIKATKEHTVVLFKATTSSAKKTKLKDKSVGVRPKTKRKLIQCNRKPSPLLVTQRALSSDKKCRQFHGISKKLFNQIYSGIEGKFLKSHKLAPKDQLSIFYHKLKAGADNTELSTIYGVGEDLISKVFRNLVDVLFNFTKQFVGWLSKAENEATMPNSFKKHFPKVLEWSYHY